MANLALENPKFGAEGLEISPLEADMKFVHKLLYQKYLEILVLMQRGKEANAPAPKYTNV